MADDPVVDDFQRAQLGPNWTVHNGAATILDGQLAVPAREGELHGLGIVGWSGSRFAADQFSQATVAPGKPERALLQLFVRRRTSDRARYGFHWNWQPDGRWELKLDGLSPSEMLASVPGESPRAGDVLRLEVVGNEIRCYRNGAEVLRVTDGAGRLPEAGEPGMALNVRHAEQFPVPFATTWSGGSLPNGFTLPV